MLFDERMGRLESLASQDGAKVDKLNIMLQLFRVEVVELAKITQGLRGWLGKGGEVQNAALGRAIVEADLLGQSCLAGARRAGNYRDRALRPSSAENLIEI